MKLDIDFTFDVGEIEKHTVAFHWGQTWGRVRISVDGKDIVRKYILWSTGPERYEFPVGEAEVHSVRIEKSKPRLTPGLRRQRCEAFVDGKLIGEFGPSNATSAGRPQI